MPKKLTNPNYKLSYSKVVNYILDSREQRMLKANPHSTSIQKSKKYEYETALNIIILYSSLTGAVLFVKYISIQANQLIQIVFHMHKY